MNRPDDELARKIVRRLDRRRGQPGCRARASASPPRAGSRSRATASSAEPVWGLAWAMNAASPRSASVSTARATCIAAGGARAGADRVRLLAERRRPTAISPTSTWTCSPTSCRSMPTSTGLRFMAKAFAALIVWLCIAFPAAAAQSKSDTKKPVTARLVGADAGPAAGARAAAAGVGAARRDAAQEMGGDRRPLSQDEARGAAASAEAHDRVGASSRRRSARRRGSATRRCRSCRPRSGRK